MHGLLRHQSDWGEFWPPGQREASWGPLPCWESPWTGLVSRAHRHCPPSQGADGFTKPPWTTMLLDFCGCPSKSQTSSNGQILGRQQTPQYLPAWSSLRWSMGWDPGGPQVLGTSHPVGPLTSPSTTWAWADIWMSGLATTPRPKHEAVAPVNSCHFDLVTPRLWSCQHDKGLSQKRL